MNGKSRTISHWFLGNPTAANLLMLVFVLSGIIAIFTMRQEVFPTMVLDTVQIKVEYRGATASEVEAQVVEPIEQSINTLLDIRTVVSEIRAGGASTFVMLESGADSQRAIDEIRSAVTGINALPVDMDPPVITQVRDAGDDMEIGFYGFHNQHELFEFSQQARARLLALPAVGQVELEGIGEPELTIEVQPQEMRLFDLSLANIADRIQRASFELSGGAFRSSTGEYGLATGASRQFASEFAEIAMIESPSGAPLTLADVGTVQDGFRPEGVRYRINGTLGFQAIIYGAGTSTPQEISTQVRAELEAIGAQMPSGGSVIFDDDAKSYSDRAGILADSAMIGLVLVLLLLFLALETRVAIWVAAGLPVAMLGGVALFALTPYTINFVSIFAFVIVIGVVVDDAVVMGEAVFSGIQGGKTPLEAASDTLDRFSTAITLAIATNIIAFVPILFLPGEIGLFLLAIPVVTTCVFIVSLIEALWILPGHIAHSQIGTRTNTLQRRFQAGLEKLRDRHFMGWVQYALNNKGLVICLGLALAGAMFSWIVSGRVGISMQPEFESQQVHAIYSMNPGVSRKQADDMALHIEKLGFAALAEYGDEQDLEGHSTEVGAPSAHNGRVTFTLVEPEQRDFSASDFASRWQAMIGQPAELTQLGMDFVNGPGGGRDLTIELAHRNSDVSRDAADHLVRTLRNTPGVEQISYSGTSFRSEVQFELTPTGRALGFDETEISAQIRAQLDGIEAARITRGVNEVRVMVRGKQSNGTLPDLSGLILFSRSGQQAALADIATIRWQRGPVDLRRINGQKVERVEASILGNGASKALVEDLVSETILPDLERDFPGLTTWDEAIDTDEDAETADALLLSTLGMMLGIYILIAAYTRSARQGGLLLSTLPLCAAGAFLGHFVLGLELSAASFMGVLALGGLVINACLILQMRYVEGLESGYEPDRAMIEAVRDRFRPIVLSSATTLVGLTPLIFSNSIHAAPLQPVAVSIGFGMLFSIPVILILLPCLVVAFGKQAQTSLDTGFELRAAEA